MKFIITLILSQECQLPAVLFQQEQPRGLEMNFAEEYDFSPSTNLLPYGGFEVAALLARLAEPAPEPVEEAEMMDFLPLNSPVSSGWLRSKMLTG